MRSDSVFTKGGDVCQRKVLSILRDTLVKEGVEVIFGYPGGAVIPLFDVLYDAPLKVILTRHEQGAAHMADGYARATGKVGVCLATSGPGATNLVTAIATAYMDSVPMLAITGQVKTNLIGNDAFQEADVTGITRPDHQAQLPGQGRRRPRPRRARGHLHRHAPGRPGPRADRPARGRQLRKLRRAR